MSNQENSVQDGNQADSAVAEQQTITPTPRTSIEIAPNSSWSGAQIDTPIIPETRRNILISNTGMVPVVAKYIWAGPFWVESGVIVSKTVQPHEDAILDSGGRPYYHTKLQIDNNNDRRALVTYTFK